MTCCIWLRHAHIPVDQLHLDTFGRPYNQYRQFIASHVAPPVALRAWSCWYNESDRCISYPLKTLIRQFLRGRSCHTWSRARINSLPFFCSAISHWRMPTVGSPIMFFLPACEIIALGLNWMAAEYNTSKALAYGALRQSLYSHLLMVKRPDWWKFFTDPWGITGGRTRDIIIFKRSLTVSDDRISTSINDRSSGSSSSGGISIRITDRKSGSSSSGGGWRAHHHALDNEWFLIELTWLCYMCIYS